MEQTAITRTVRVAAGVFAPGHIGELTRIVPFEMVDEVLAQTGAVQRRVRLVPARVTVYLLPAAALFTGLGYRQVFDRLCAGLAGLVSVRPSGSALRQARQRLGPAPMKALFDLISGPAATATAAGRWRGLRVVAVDGTLLPVPDCAANLTVFTRQRLGNGISGYPQLRLTALVACGTRSVIAAVFGPATIRRPAAVWRPSIPHTKRAGSRTTRRTTPEGCCDRLADSSSSPIGPANRGRPGSVICPSGKYCVGGLLERFLPDDVGRPRSGVLGRIRRLQRPDR